MKELEHASVSPHHEWPYVPGGGEREEQRERTGSGCCAWLCSDSQCLTSSNDISQSAWGGGRMKEWRKKSEPSLSGSL